MLICGQRQKGAVGPHLVEPGSAVRSGGVACAVVEVEA